jgi:hypothetical protein
MAAARDAERANRGRESVRESAVQDWQSMAGAGVSTFDAERMAALIAWMLVVRVDDLVKDGAKRRRLRRSSILDKIINTNRVLSKRSRPLSKASHVLSDRDPRPS